MALVIKIISFETDHTWSKDLSCMLAVNMVRNEG